MAIEFYIFIWIVFGLVIGLINLLFAIKIFEDASAFKERSGKSTFLVGAIVWALATILFGVFAVGIYWMIHYSTLKPNFEGKMKD